MNKRIKEYRLLFKGKRDGFGSKDFHSKCDNKSYTVSFVKSKEGRRFGGFTDVEWDQSNSYKKGSNGFIFSLDNNEIYYNKNSNHNIYCCSNDGPAFGRGHDFCISDNCDKNRSYDNSCHSYNIKGKNYALAGKEYFYVEDYEVYKIELE